MNRVKTGTNRTEHRGFARQEGEDNETQVSDIRMVQVITIVHNTRRVGSGGSETRHMENRGVKQQRHMTAGFNQHSVSYSHL